MQHVFIDVEAFGPPGVGRPFAFGAAKFDIERGIYNRAQWNIDIPGLLSADRATMEWLLKQEQRVLAQTRGGSPFTKQWMSFLEWVLPPFTDDRQVTFWADDWSDFAWLDIDARGFMVKPLRDVGAQYDSSPIVKLANPLKVYSTEKHGELVPHIAEHDAVSGALDLIASLHILGRDLP